MSDGLDELIKSAFYEGEPLQAGVKWILANPDGELFQVTCPWCGSRRTLKPESYPDGKIIKCKRKKCSKGMLVPALSDCQPCPFCSGYLRKVDAASCKHCRSELSWIEGYVCKPGEEHLIEQQIAAEEQRQLKYEAELRIAREDYEQLANKHGRAMVLALIIFLGMCFLCSLQRYLLALLSFVAFLVVLRFLVHPRADEMRELKSKYREERLQ